MPDWRLEVLRRLATLNLAPLRETEIVEEVAQHLEDRYRELMAGGAAEIEARRMALEELSDGDLLAQALRRVEHEAPSIPDVPGGGMGGGFWTGIGEDFRFGLRVLRRSPGFAAVAMLTLALGIGANAAIFSLIDAVMLRPLPAPHAQSLVILKWSARQWPNTGAYYAWSGCPAKAHGPSEPAAEGCTFSYPMFEQIRAENQIFSEIFAMIPSPQLEVSIDGNAGFAGGEFVSGEFFPALGIRTALGRAIGPSDDLPAAPPVVMLSYNYWQGQFGGSPAVVGKRIVVNGVPFSVAGVGPRGFLGLDPGLVDDLWLPFSTRALVTPYVFKATDATAWWLMIGARLRPRVAAAQAQAEAEVVFRRGVTGGASPALKLADAPHLELISMARGLTTLRKRFADPLFLLMVAVGLVLLIACTNVASLMLARMAAREKELAVRCALGAGRWRIFRQLLAESLLLAAAGGLWGILLAYLGARSLAAFLSANWYSPLEINVLPDVRILGFALAIATLTGILFGLAPALRSGRIDVAPALKESPMSPLGSSAAGKRFGLGNVLVVAQVALSILVLVGASLLVRTLINLATLNVGFEARNVILFGLNPELSGYKGERLANLYSELQQHLSAIPGVSAVGSSSVPLISGGYMTEDVFYPDQPGQSTQVDVLNVGQNFFETMRIPLLAGRTFNLQDFDNASAPKKKIAMVNQSLARQFFGQQWAIGRLISTDKGKPPDIEIIGVVGDTKYESLRGAIQPTVYFPMEPGGGTFEVRTALDPKLLLPSIREAVKSVARGLPIYHLMTQAEQIDRALFQERLVAWLSGAFALLALVVACIGLYGLMSFEVARRTHEVGIRLALGASQAQVLGMVLGRGLRLVTAGAVVGIGMALGLARYLQSLLYGVRPMDPLAYAAGTLLLLVVTLAACCLPARRAARVDPLVALRYE